MESPTTFELPFPRAVLGDLTQAQERHARWVRKMDVLSTPEEIKQLMEWGPERAGAYFHPKARGEDRFLATDFYGWMILLDGQFDGEAGRDSTRAHAMVQGLLAALDGGAWPTVPGELALADIWRRLCSGMSPAWRDRAEKDMKDYITAHRIEAAHRVTGHCPSPQEYLRLRFDSGGTGIILDIAERLHRFEVSPTVWGNPLVQRLREITVHVTDVVQDVLSLAKEECDGEWNNIVIVLMRDDPALTREAAISRVHAMVAAWVEEFLTLEARIPGMCNALHLPSPEREAVHQYSDAMRSCIQGNYDWCRTTPRYDSHQVAGRTASGLLGAMLYTTPSRPPLDRP
ncbi:hypothetical protein P8605_02325 [Streptomyces sp. T-3]|nr:hypothetical protein [Streptomyces sp. T-3]